MRFIIAFFTIFLVFIPAFTFGANKPLNIPFTTQIPNGKWINPWSNACEETSITMVNQYYLGEEKNIIPKKAISLISPLFSYENKNFGENYDSNSYRTLRIINENTVYTGEIKTSPTLQEIKDHLKLGLPIISLHYGFKLPNKNLHFRATGSSYHMMVVGGFDNTDQTFITNDPGDTVKGDGFRYKYDAFLKSLGDFDHITKKVNTKKPTVILTYPKLARTSDTTTVYYLSNGGKYAITDNDLFKKNNWTYTETVILPQETLNHFIDKGPLKEDQFVNKQILAKTKNKPIVYLVYGTTKQKISNPRTLKQLGYKNNEIKIVEDAWLNNFSKGETISL